MEGVIVTREVLDLYDKYHGDFGLMDERWANPKDLQKASDEQMMLLSEYVDKLHFSKLDPTLYCLEMRERARERIAELEKVIDVEVVAILRKRGSER